MNLTLLFFMIFNVKSTDYEPCKTYVDIIKEEGKEAINFKECDYISGKNPSSDKKACSFDSSGNCLEIDIKCSDIKEESKCESFVPNGSSSNCVYEDGSCTNGALRHNYSLLISVFGILLFF